MCYIINKNMQESMTNDTTVSITYMNNINMKSICLLFTGLYYTLQLIIAGLL